MNTMKDTCLETIHLLVENELSHMMLGKKKLSQQENHWFSFLTRLISVTTSPNTSSRECNPSEVKSGRFGLSSVGDDTRVIDLPPQVKPEDIERYIEEYDSACDL